MHVPTARCDGYFADCGFIALTTEQISFSMLPVAVLVTTQIQISIWSIFPLLVRLGYAKRKEMTQYVFLKNCL